VISILAIHHFSDLAKTMTRDAGDFELLVEFEAVMPLIVAKTTGHS